jgi:hypothetical protein
MIERRAIPNQVKMEALLAAGHMCCVCRGPGESLQIHHIDEDPGNNDLSNLAVLCLRHHSLAHTRGGFGRQLDARQLRYCRDSWSAAVRHRGETAISPSGKGSARRDAHEPLLQFLGELLTIDFSWEGPFRGEFGEYTALEDEAHFQLPERESLKTKPRLFHTYWGLIGSKLLTPEIFASQATAVTRRLEDRLSTSPWIETHLPDYQASPIEGSRRIRSVRHTAKAASILLLTAPDGDLVAEILWNLVDSTGEFMNADGGCREELFEQASSIYTSAYMLQLFESVLALDNPPASMTELDRWASKAGDAIGGLHRFMAADWEADKWKWGNTPWQVNAPYIAIDVGPWLRPELRGEVRAALRDELTPAGRLRDAGLGDRFGAPEPIRALRVAFALESVGASAAEDPRLQKLRSWLLKQDWSKASLRSCDMAFLAHVAAEG